MKTQRQTPLGYVVLLAMICLVAVTAHAQNVIPPTAVQAAKMPQYASRLAHRSSGKTITKAVTGHPRGVCSKMHPGSPQDGNVIYSNGPTNGNTDAWNIGFGFVVSDSFTVGNGGATVTGMTFAAWLFPGDTLPSVTIGITSAENGGTVYFNQSLTITQSGCVVNGLGFDICNETTSALNVNLSSGTYWVNLQNGEATDGDSVYWDENSGIGCTSQGCPSSASSTSVGTIPSESFTISGPATLNACMPEHDGNFAVFHDFNGTDGSGPVGVAIDRAGNLYGPAQTSGGSGTVYKLLQEGSSWLLSTLYNFLGGADGSSPAGVIVGPNNNLYGAAQGGLQNCTSGGYCGYIFGLRPGATPCLSGSCSWTNNVLYRFTGPTDAWQGDGLVSDQAGNLYGVSASGGAQQQGAIFELTPSLTPSLGGWVETILYSFTGAGDGGDPTTIIVGNDGKLYGMAGAGGAYGGGTVFQLTPSTNGWTEAVLYNMPPNQYDSTFPHSLLQDSAGNLFGVYQYTAGPGNQYDLIFMLSPSNGTWAFTELYHGNESYDGSDLFPNMILDAAGNLLGTGGGHSGCYPSIDHGYIFELTRANDWQYSMPVSWNYTDFPTGGALALDTEGNLYGTTSYCGTHNQGTVWKISGVQ